MDDDSIPGFDILIPTFVLNLAPVAIVLVCGLILYRTKAHRRFVWRYTPQSRRESMVVGFLETVEYTANTVRKDRTEPSSSEPMSGGYRCVMKDQEITDKKTNETVSGGGPAIVFSVQLKFTYDIESKGWSIAGKRLTKNDCFEIEQGFVAFSGKAYWVERCGDVRLLANGYFKGNSFYGEWLSSSGIRGRYHEFKRYQDPEKKLEAFVAVPLDQPRSSFLWKVWPFSRRTNEKLEIETAVPVGIREEIL